MIDEVSDLLLEGWDGLRCFNRVQFGKVVVIVYHSSTLMYANPYDDKDLDCRYGEGVFSVRVKEFHAICIHISNDMEDSNMMSQSAWILPTPLSPLTFYSASSVLGRG